MFIALLINPVITLYHIVIHALFKSLLFLLSGSLIHIQFNHQSIYKLKIKHSFIKTILLFAGSVLILSLSKETIIYSANSIFTSIFIILILILGAIYTVIYTFNIYLKCFYYTKSISLSKQSLFYYSFIIPFLILSSIFLDISLEYSISLNIGSLFYSIDYGTLISYLIFNEHFSIICVIIPITIFSLIYHFRSSIYLLLLSNSLSSSLIKQSNFNLVFSFYLILFNYLIKSIYYSFSSNSTFFIPIYQDLFILMSSYFFKGPINLLEVMSCLNYCYNLYHIHYFNILFIIYLLLILILILMQL